jgi:catalase
VAGEVYRHDSGDEDNFSQATIFWNNVLDEAARKRLVSNIAGHLVNAQGFLQERAISNFSKVSADFGKQLTEAINLKKSAKM